MTDSAAGLGGFTYRRRSLLYEKFGNYLGNNYFYQMGTVTTKYNIDFNITI